MDVYRMGRKAQPLEELLDPATWPSLGGKAAMLGKYDALAVEMNKRGTDEGYFASVAICSQIVEAFIIHTLELSDRLLAVRMWPMYYGRGAEFRKSAPLGTYIDSLLNAVDFKGKQDFIDSITAFNKDRNKLLHHLFVSNNEIPVKQIAEHAINIYETRVRTGYGNAHTQVRNV